MNRKRRQKLSLFMLNLLTESEIQVKITQLYYKYKYFMRIL